MMRMRYNLKYRMTLLFFGVLDVSRDGLKYVGAYGNKCSITSVQ